MWLKAGEVNLEGNEGLALLDPSIPTIMMFFFCFFVFLVDIGVNSVRKHVFFETSNVIVQCMSM